MRFFIQIVLVFFLLAEYSFGQKAALTGTKTIGATGCDYATIDAAIVALNANGVGSGGVTFILKDETYTFTVSTSTSKMQITTTDGTSSRLITFKPDAGVTPEITITANSTYPYGFKMGTNAVDYVIFDGSNSGGTSRDMKIIMTGVNSSGFYISDGANNITIKNCIIQGYSNASSNNGINIYFGGATTSNNNTFQNNEIYKVYNGIYYNGWATGSFSNNSIKNNLIGSSTASLYVTAKGIGMDAPGISSLEISGNEIFNMITSSGICPTGIYIYTNSATSGITISKNKIHDLVYTGSSGYGGKGIFMNVSTANPNITVKNNFIWHMGGDGDASTQTPMGIDVATSSTSGVYIYFNSIYLTQETTYGLYSGSDFAAAIAFRGATGVDFRNNILSCNTGEKSGGTSTGYAVYCSSGTSPFSNCNNNIYYITNHDNNYIGRSTAKATYSTLAAWQAFTGGDANSYVTNPNYTSTSNLHITNTNDKGTPISGITDDIDNESRNASTPDAGADETNVSLPISLLSFYGECLGDKNIIKWSTASETNNDHFVIESSVNGIDWVIVTVVEGAGNSNTSLEYSIADENISAEKSYYRLRQVDHDGAYEYFGPISVACGSNPVEFISLYPNPAGSSFEFVVNSEKGKKIRISLVNILGQTVYNSTLSIQQGSNVFNVNTENLAKSIYYFTVESTDGMFIEKKQVMIE